MNDQSSNMTTINLFAYLRGRIEENMPPRALARMRAEEAGETIDEAALEAAESEIKAERSRAGRKKLLELAKEVWREHEQERGRGRGRLGPR